jgi:hypothetical protein
MKKYASRSSVASIKKIDERSEFRVAFDLALAFSRIHNKMNQKLPLELSESEVQ